MTGAVQEQREALEQCLLPRPHSLVFGSGSLPWNGAAFALQVQGSFTAQAQLQLTDMLQHFVKPESVPEKTPRKQRHEIPLRVYCAGDAPVLSGVGTGAGSKDDALRSDAYSLEITADEIALRAHTSLGVLRGMQTLSQILVHADAWGAAAGGSALPCLKIEDQPAFAWRGLLIDVARHFIELPALLRTVDGMAHHKLNVLHLHLTDDQAYRFPSEAYKKLNASGPTYTREELRELVAYAQARGVRIVPELDMPGHTTCWLAAYPHWSLYEVAPSKRFGVHKGCLNPTSDETYEVIATLLAEFAEVFPDECVHVGGDEVHPQWWSEHQEVRSFMQQRGFDNPRDLQAYFNTRVSDVLAKLGKRMLVWDEAVHERLPKNTLVQAWRGMTARDAVVARGYPCIVSAPYYLDLFYPSDLHTRFEPLQPIEEAIAAEDQMLADERLTHVAGGLEWTKQWRDRPDDLAAGDAGSAELASNVLGGEACLWSELVSTQLLDVRLWSRLPLIAELFWSGTVDEPAYTRTAHSLRSWHACGGPELAVAIGEPLSKDQLDMLAASGIDATVAPLLAVLEPSKWYSRLLGSDALAARLQGSEMPQARPYDVNTELCSIACVISPQSFVTAQFTELCERWRAAPLSEQDQKAVSDWISVWQQQKSAVEALKVDDDIAQQLLALAQRLQHVAVTVQALLDRFGGRRLSEDAGSYVASYLADTVSNELASWSAPVGELMLAPAVALVRLQNQLRGSQPN